MASHLAKIVLALTMAINNYIFSQSIQEHLKTTYDIILAQTGFSKNSFTRLANDRADMVGISAVDRLYIL